METCPQCGAITPLSDIDGHPYFGASKGCWAVYGEVLSREYSDTKFFKNHRQTVDAYALQHPGGGNPRAVQSVNIHLIALTLLYGVNLPSPSIPKIMDSIVKKKRKPVHSFKQLVPPNNLGDIIVTDIFPLTAVEDHLYEVDRWARNVWAAWEMHHHVAWHYIHEEGIT